MRDDGRHVGGEETPAGVAGPAPEAPAEEMSPPPPPPSEPPDEPPPEPIAEEPPRRFDLAAVRLGVLGRRSGAS
jgi:hypothetical protein